MCEIMKSKIFLLTRLLGSSRQHKIAFNTNVDLLGKLLKSELASMSASINSNFEFFISKVNIFQRESVFFLVTDSSSSLTIIKLPLLFGILGRMEESRCIADALPFYCLAITIQIHPMKYFLPAAFLIISRILKRSLTTSSTLSSSIGIKTISSPGKHGIICLLRGIQYSLTIFRM